MVKTAFRILAGAAAAGIVLAPGVASAATAGPAVLAYSSDPSVGPPTTVTFTVTAGDLGMTAPDSADLGNGLPGATISGPLGPVVVTDDRALLTAAWTATASSTNWTTGAASSAETIPAGDVGYDPGTVSKLGTITATGTPITLSGTAAPVVTGTAGVGDNTASWNPAIALTVPAFVVAGGYSAILTQSVS